MKAKIISIAVFILLAYVSPLLGRTELIPTFQVGILVIFVAALFSTQPTITIVQTKADHQSDKYSVLLLLLGYLLGQVVVTFEWAYFIQYRDWLWDFPTILGLSMMVTGTVFRIWCIRTLGKFFTATVKIQEKHQVITGGAYKYLRHPSYSGAFIAAIGSTVFMHAPFATLFTFIVLFIAYHFRIKAEEETLVKEFGEEYLAYQKLTKKLVPWIY